MLAKKNKTNCTSKSTWEGVTPFPTNIGESMREIINTSEASKIALESYGLSLTLPTIIDYVKKSNSGFQLGDKFSEWKVYKEKWVAFLEEKCNG